MYKMVPLNFHLPVDILHYQMYEHVTGTFDHRLHIIYPRQFSSARQASPTRQTKLCRWHLQSSQGQGLTCCKGKKRISFRHFRMTVNKAFMVMSKAPLHHDGTTRDTILTVELNQSLHNLVINNYETTRTYRFGMCVLASLKKSSGPQFKTIADLYSWIGGTEGS
jgi:hypothetical protein